MSNTSFKIYFSPSDVRRFSTSRAGYQDFVHKLQSLYPIELAGQFTLRYVDKDGDNINVTSELEWQEMFREQTKEPIKISVVRERSPVSAKVSSQTEPTPAPTPSLNEEDRSSYAETQSKPTQVDTVVDVMPHLLGNIDFPQLCQFYNKMLPPETQAALMTQAQQLASNISDNLLNQNAFQNLVQTVLQSFPSGFPPAVVVPTPIVVTSAAAAAAPSPAPVPEPTPAPAPASAPAPAATPAPAPTPVPVHKYGKQIAQLREMGFEDQRVIPLLEKHRGNIERAVQELFNSM